jgi:hypothetical protein
MLQHILKAILMAAIMGAPLAAQMRGGLPTLAPTARPSFGSRAFRFPDGHRGVPAAVYLGTPFWGDDWTSYTSSPSVIVIQAPAPSAVKQNEDAKPIMPVMIELEGGRYVRRSADETAKSNSPRTEMAAQTGVHGSTGPSSEARFARGEAPPTVFVFRDGRRAESSDYSIISGVIYAKDDYWKTGTWCQNIKISDLDLSATERANRDRGVSFRLPGAPNEVITRP